MKRDVLYRAFSKQLTDAGLIVREATEKTRAGDLHVLVSEQLDSSTWIALFGFEEPEYISLTLNNGARFWENEWSNEYQEIYAKTYGEIVLHYLQGKVKLKRGRLRGDQFLVDVDNEVMTTRYVVDAPSLAEIANLWHNSGCF